MRLDVVGRAGQVMSGAATMVDCYSAYAVVEDIEPATTFIWQLELQDGTACVAHGREESSVAAGLGCATFAEIMAGTTP